MKQQQNKKFYIPSAQQLDEICQKGYELSLIHIYHEPRLALDGSEDGLYFYRVLALECSKHLNKGGCVYFEIGYDQAEAVSRILTIAGYREIEVIKDEPGLNRVVKARWNR